MVDDAIECILQLGTGTALVKLDLKNTYCIVQVHPQDHHLFTITGEGETYINCALSFVRRLAPKIFSAVEDMAALALLCSGICHQIIYLDDFLFVGTPNSTEGARLSL